MASKRRPQSYGAEINYFEGLIKFLTKRSVYDAKGVLLLCKSLFPNNFRVKIIEYELSKETNNFKQAAGILADIFNSEDPFLVSEINCIVSGLNTLPMDPVCQQIYMALPHRVQYDALTKFTWSSFSSAPLRANFLLDFLRSKVILLDANHLMSSMLGVLVDLLVDSEIEHCNSLSNASVHLPTKPKSEKPPKIMSPPAKRAIKSPPVRDPLEEGEEGEVLEEGEEECEDLDEDDEEDFENRNDSSKNNTQIVYDVLNVFRMKLACDVLPMAYQVRQTFKIGIAQLEKLVTKSFQFLLSYAAKLPFSRTDLQKFPNISGLTEPLPEILQQEPSKYLRLYLDMSSELLNWPVSDSFQVQPREDLFRRLRECVNFYVTAEHDVAGTHQRSRKRNQRGSNPSTSSVALHAISCQTVCLYWSLFIETAVEYAKKCTNSETGCVVPVNLTRILEPVVLNQKLPQDISSYDSLLCSIQDLQKIRLNSIVSSFSQPYRECRSHRNSDVSVIQTIDISVRPQDFDIYTLISSRKCQLPDSVFESCGLERFIRLHLLLLCRCGDTNSEVTWGEECIKTSISFVDETSSILPYSKVQLMCLKSLVGAISFIGQVPEAQSARKVLLQDLISLLEVEDVLGTSPLSTRSYLFSYCGANVNLLDLSSSLSSLQVCHAVVENWLIARSTASTDNSNALNRALLILVLHQNEIWKHVLASSTETEPLLCGIFKLLKANWSVVRPQLFHWLKLAFIVDASLLAQLAQMEWELHLQKQDLEFVSDCIRYIKQPSNVPTVFILGRFIKAEMTRIQSCLFS